MALIDGDQAVLDDPFPYTIYNEIKNHWRDADAPGNIQPGMIWSDSDDDKLYHHGAADEEILQLTRSSDVKPQFAGLWINETSNVEMTWGITMNQLDEDDEILALKSSDVDHGITNWAETDTYGSFKKYSGNSGGLWIMGFTEVDVAIVLGGDVTTDNTDKDGTAKAPVMINASKKSGTGHDVMGVDANLFVIREYVNARFIFDKDGDMFYDGAAPANYDKFNDPVACHDLARHLYNIRKPIDEQLTDFIEYNWQDLVTMGVISNGGFVSTKNMTTLILGAISQLYKENQMLNNKLKQLEN